MLEVEAGGRGILTCPVASFLPGASVFALTADVEAVDVADVVDGFATPAPAVAAGAAALVAGPELLLDVVSGCLSPNPSTSLTLSINPSIIAQYCR